MDLEGKRILVTGANSGIGRVTALELARAGAHVVLVCRSPERGQEALEHIHQTIGDRRAELLLCDLSSAAEIRQLGEEVRARYDRLDVLVNNAGAYFAERRETADGLEMTFGLNHMGYFRLTRELLGLLEASSPARIVNVASEGHRLGKLNFDDIQWKRRRYKGLRAYSDSKLMNILFTRELARRIQGTGVTANSLHPGVIRSGFAVGEQGAFAQLVRFGSKVLMSPEQGALNSIHLAGSSQVEGQSGLYFMRRKPAKPTRAARNDTDAARLWELSEALEQG